MTTTTTETSFPTLTLLESDAAIAVAWGAPDTSMLQIAARLKLAPSELVEILERPHVAAFAQAARELKLMREDAVARHDHATALDNLARIASDQDATVEVRLSAAIAILRGVRNGPPLPTNTSPRQLPPNDRPPSPRLYLPAPKPPGTPTVPGGQRPDQPRNNQLTPTAATNPRPLPATQQATKANFPITLHRAAGAPRAASPAIPGHPP